MAFKIIHWSSQKSFLMTYLMDGPSPVKGRWIWPKYKMFFGWLGFKQLFVYLITIKKITKNISELLKQKMTLTLDMFMYYIRVNCRNNFLSNRNIHKSSYGLCFWASNPLIERFWLNLSIKGSEAQKLVWM